MSAPITDCIRRSAYLIADTSRPLGHSTEDMLARVDALLTGESPAIVELARTFALERWEEFCTAVA